MKQTKVSDRTAHTYLDLRILKARIRYLGQASPLDVFLPSRDFKNAEKLSFNLEF